MRAEQAIKTFGNHWFHVIDRGSSLTRFPLLKPHDLRNGTVRIHQELGTNSWSMNEAATEEQSLLDAAKDLLRMARDNIESLDKLHRRFCKPHPVVTPLRLGHDVWTGKRSARKEFSRDLRAIREHNAAILTCGTAAKLAGALQQFLGVQVKRLEGDLDIPSPVYGRGESDIPLYLVNVPTYLAEASDYWIQECRISNIEVREDYDRRTGGGYSLKYEIRDPERKGRTPHTFPIKHQQLHEMASGGKEYLKTSLRGRYIFVSKDAALRFIEDNKAKVIEDLKHDVTIVTARTEPEEEAVTDSPAP